MTDRGRRPKSYKGETYPPRSSTLPINGTVPVYQDLITDPVDDDSKHFMPLPVNLLPVTGDILVPYKPLPIQHIPRPTGIAPVPCTSYSCETFIYLSGGAPQMLVPELDAVRMRRCTINFYGPSVYANRPEHLPSAAQTALAITGNYAGLFCVVGYDASAIGRQQMVITNRSALYGVGIVNSNVSVFTEYWD